VCRQGPIPDRNLEHPCVWSDPQGEFALQIRQLKRLAQDRVWMERVLADERVDIVERLVVDTRRRSAAPEPVALKREGHGRSQEKQAGEKNDPHRIGRAAVSRASERLRPADEPTPGRSISRWDGARQVSPIDLACGFGRIHRYRERSACG
jgi:hypothetical protein